MNIIVSLITSVFMTAYMIISMCVKMQMIAWLSLFGSSLLQESLHFDYYRCMAIMVLLQLLWIYNNTDLFMMDITILLEKIRGLH